MHGTEQPEVHGSTPPRPRPATEETFPIVGIGASAGGLAAFEAFFSGMPGDVDPNMAFVLVQHLSPDHKSSLAELLRRVTRMAVHDVEDGMRVRRNCAYIIPPNRDMALHQGTLRLLEPTAPRGQRLPIDFFFHSLAQDQGDRAICVVLSGTGSDGSMGVRAIKAEGGLALAQSPETAEYDGMPRAAALTGLVDFVLPPSKMPAQLMAYASRAFGAPPTAAPTTPASEAVLGRAIMQLRAQTGHDFSQYKTSTIQRRIARRMAVHQLDSGEEYARFLSRTPAEVEALFRDLLIGVTGFFRDPDAFRVLEQEVIPPLLAAKPPGGAVRVWSVGCSTGEEAYSIAILIDERLQSLKQSYKVQVFATDIDREALAVARAGLFPASIEASVSPERLGRYFSSDGVGYRIHKSIRDTVVFSEQDVIKDPPFSKLDLVSCRNLLIYMGSDLQRRVLDLFHYALNPEAVLFLGNSETVGDPSDLFSPVDRKAKLYRRLGNPYGTQRARLGDLHRPMGAALPRSPGPSESEARPSLRELTEQALLQELSPVAAVVNDRGDLLYLHGRTGLYLEPPPGEVTLSNILTMAREGLRRDLAMALHGAATAKETTRVDGVKVKTNGDSTLIDLTVRPMWAGGSAVSQGPLYLVVFQPAREVPVQPTSEVAASHGALTDDGTGPESIAALKKELLAKEEYLQSANEELETSNEELKSSNEELQSVNEELQSTNEELETSREELQSVNEELATVNGELQAKVVDLSRTNNDMNNLLAGTGIGTVFVDHQLRIVRFTPAATSIINLIPGDIGRPVGHLVANLVGYDRLVADIQRVLDTLIPKVVEVQTLSGGWHSMRISPYRTLDNVIEGAVITFVDVTGEKHAREALAESESGFRLLVESLPFLVWTFRPDGSCDYLSPKWIEFTGVPNALQLGKGWLEQVHLDDRPRLLEAAAAGALTGEPFRIEFRLRHRSGRFQSFDVRLMAIQDGSGGIARWVGMNLESDGGSPTSPTPGDEAATRAGS